MNKKKKGALTPSPFNSEGKDNEIFFENNIRQEVFELFLSGGKYSVVELSEKLHIPDPRSHIRFIREKVVISDYWVKTDFSKYKVYFLHNTEGGVK